MAVIVVSGTGRSGTSLAMQALEAAGVPVLGQRFPLDWGERYPQANPRGFYESLLIQGIHFETNPDPSSGVELVPEQVEGWGVKVFSAGLRRSERRFLERVLLCVRGWRGFRRSLREMGDPEGPFVQAGVEPASWWAQELVATVEDAMVRRYPLEILRFETVLEEPSRLGESLAFLGPEAAHKGLEVVQPRRLRAEATPGDLRGDPSLLDAVEACFEHGRRADWRLLRELRSLRSEFPGPS